MQITGNAQFREGSGESAPHPADADLDPPTGDPGNGLDGLLASLRGVDSIMAQALRQLRATRSSRAAAEAGLPLERLLALACDRPRRDIAFLMTCDDILSVMPALDRAFAEGRVSWAQLRMIVTAARPLTNAQRGELDDRLAADLDVTADPEWIGMRAFGHADRIAHTTAEDRETKDVEGNRFVAQPNLHGGVEAWMRLDAEAGATVLDAIDHAADPPRATSEVVRDADGREINPRHLPNDCRSAERAEGLRRIAATYLGGHPDEPAATGTAGDAADAGPADAEATGSADADTDATAAADADATVTAAADPGIGAGAADRPPTGPSSSSSEATTPGSGPEPPRPQPASPGPQPPHTPSPPQKRPAWPATPARPRVLAVINYRDAAAHGWLLTRATGGRIPISRLTAERLQCDATTRTILTNGNRPIATGDSYAPITPTIRDALTAVDLGCRWPGCTTPAPWCDAHHLIPRADGGPTTIDNLVLLCRTCHTRTHRRDWQLALNPDTRRLTVARKRLRFTSLPA